MYITHLLHSGSKPFTMRAGQVVFSKLTDVGSVVGDHVLVVIDSRERHVLPWHGRHMKKPLGIIKKSDHHLVKIKVLPGHTWLQHCVLHSYVGKVGTPP